MNRSSQTVQNQIEETLGVHDLVTAYQQLAAQKMTQTRRVLDGTRDYFQGLSKLSEEIGVDVVKIDEEKKQTVLLMSSDNKMYGDLLERIFGKFLEYIKKNPIFEIWVIGKVGAQMMKTVAPDRKFIETTREQVSKMLSTRHLEIFHGDYKNLAFQDAGVSSITDLSVEKKSNLENQTKYYYEPSILEVTEVFRESITSGLVEHTQRESDMAFAAARVIHLEKIIDNTNKAISVLKKRFFSVQKKTTQRKMMHLYQNVKIKNKL